MKDVKNKRIGGLDQSISEQAKASGSAIQEALKKQQAGKTSTATSGTSSGAASSILGSAGKTILGGGAIGGISATSPAVQGTARQAAAKTTPKSGSGTTGTGGGAATVTKPTNPYDNPESYGPENPYAKILAGIGGQGDNPYAGRMGQGGENPYAGMMGQGGVNPYADLVGQGGGNPYAAMIGQGGVNPYADLVGQGGGNPYAAMMGQGGVNPYADLTGQGGENPYLEMMREAGEYKGTIPEAEAAREGLYGVSDATKQQMDKYGQYSASQEVQGAQDYLERLRGQAPGEYSDPYAEQLSQLYEQITGRPGFQYDLNGDMLYKQYAQQYQQMGKQAMQDTMGQAAAMTGGYGSSYASVAGNQAYQGYLQQLNDKIPELYDRALKQYQMEGDQLKDQYSMLRDLQDTDYGRYQDELSRYYQDLGIAREDYQQERAFDYGKYSDEQDYWTRMAQLESQDARTSQQYELQRAQMLTDEARDQRDYRTKLQQLASDEDWKQREYDLGMLDRQTDWDQQQRDYDLKLQQLASDEDWKQRDYDLTARQLQSGWDQDARDYALKLQQLASDEDWKQREYDLGMLDRQTAWDQQQREYEQGVLDRQTAWDQDQQQQAYQLMMQMLQMGVDPSDALKTTSGVSPYDIYGMQQALKPTSGTYYGGTGTSTGTTKGTSTGTTSTGTGVQPTTTPKATGKTDTTKKKTTEMTDEELYLAGQITAQELYQRQMRRAYGK